MQVSGKNLSSVFKDLPESLAPEEGKKIGHFKCTEDCTALALPW